MNGQAFFILIDDDACASLVGGRRGDGRQVLTDLIYRHGRSLPEAVVTGAHASSDCQETQGPRWAAPALHDERTTQLCPGPARNGLQVDGVVYTFPGRHQAASTPVYATMMEPDRRSRYSSFYELYVARWLRYSSSICRQITHKKKKEKKKHEPAACIVAVSPMLLHSLIVVVI